MQHEAPLSLFRERPELAAELLRDALGVAVPEHAVARVEEADFTQIVPTPYHADLVITLVSEATTPVMGIILERQLHRDPGKRFTWPLYLASNHAKLRCATCLVVLAATEEMATWASEPIATLQPGSPFVPIVLGPSRVPVVTSIADAERSPEGAVLSALVHGGGEHGLEVARAALAAASRLIDEARSTFYTDLILDALRPDARALLEKNMDLTNYEFRSDLFRSKIENARAQGEARGEARAVLTLLATRGVHVTEELRAHILACADVALLDRWVARAVTAATTEEVLADR